MIEQRRDYPAGCCVRQEARLRRWVVLYKAKRMKKWRVEQSIRLAGNRAPNTLNFAFLYPCRRIARMGAKAFRDNGYSARVRKAFIEIPLEP